MWYWCQEINPGKNVMAVSIDVLLSMHRGAIMCIVEEVGIISGDAPSFPGER